MAHDGLETVPKGLRNFLQFKVGWFAQIMGSVARIWLLFPVSLYVLFYPLFLWLMNTS